MVNESNSVQQPTSDDAVSDLVEALLEAARYDDLDDVVSLYSLGVSLNAKDSQGRTALHMAAANGHVDIVEYLIRNGVDVNASNNEKNTPLHWACLNGKKEVVKALILAGAKMEKLFCADIGSSGGQPERITSPRTQRYRAKKCCGAFCYERTPMDEAVGRGEMQVVDAVNAAVAQAELQGVSVN
ncbi:hypothetical protein M5K25_019064 [Dendrobium thyrsiflorum]|uniref:Uncharacterized protein n=1 Tax=Dendrobium thyrsiflorum TaxID=117978 RepID=A0ABD0UDZ2_DENTH